MKEGVAEHLPFPDSSFDYALMVTTICFVDDVDLALKETARVLKKNGLFVLAFVDRESVIGKEYLRMKEKSLFYREALFFSTEELLKHLEKAGLTTEKVVQTVFGKLNQVKEIHPSLPGYGKGSFVVIRSRKKKG